MLAYLFVFFRNMLANPASTELHQAANLVGFLKLFAGRGAGKVKWPIPVILILFFFPRKTGMTMVGNALFPGLCRIRTRLLATSKKMHSF